ncbi:LacI family transcriptional regulator [Paenibacillus ginsengarvi]|uniref:LacI family transcriptional regulator n=2 Tax=Paenibacillus ginsengarvi TaxID=400777 RepID=A0A3B0CMN2_9BACL|nr:LacI family transcriptional regulator [Paenibacillus ginsengarvi]
MRKKKAITLQHIADAAGVSVQTVSKALRGLTGVSEQERHRLFYMAQQMGYASKAQERAQTVEQIPLHSSKPYRFKLILPSRSSKANLMNPLLAEGLQQKMTLLGHTVEQLALPAEGKLSVEAWARLHQLEHYDGLFLAPMLDKESLEAILQYSVPQILIYFVKPGMRADSVIWDVGAAVRQSVEYLVQHGHHRILYIGDYLEEWRGFVLRWDAFVMTMREYGLTAAREDHMLRVRTTDRRSNMDEFAYMVRKMNITAVLCGVNYHLSWIYRACAENGIRIPEHLSLISLENTTNPSWPELSRPKLRIREAGARAAERMLWRIANPNAPYEHTMLQGDFVPGKTVMSL